MARHLRPLQPWFVVTGTIALVSCGDEPSETPPETTPTASAPVTPGAPMPSETNGNTQPVSPTTAQPTTTVAPISPTAPEPVVPSVTPTTTTTGPDDTSTPPTGSTNDTTTEPPTSSTDDTTSEPPTDTTDDTTTEPPPEVEWTSSGNTWSATVGETTLVVDAATGGRILGFALGTTEMLLDESEITYSSGGSKPNANNYGSTFWLSPQTQWNDSGWPPPVHMDSDPYAAMTEGAVLSLVGDQGSDPGTDNTAEITVTKVITPDPANNAFVIDYQMTNHGASASDEWAPWQITRAGSDGITFFPTGPGDCDAGCPKELNVTAQGAYSFWVYDMADVSDADGAEHGDKWIGDSAKGWIGHAYEGVLLLMQFEDIAAGDAPPKEGDVAIYASGQDPYIEIEPQGAAAPIPAGGTVSWKVRWSLHALPDTVPAELGETLGDFADALATQLGAP